MNTKYKKLLESSLEEKASSISQQELFGAAYAFLKYGNKKASNQAKKLAEEFKEKYGLKNGLKKLRDFAKTKHEGLPKHVEESVDDTTVIKFGQIYKDLSGKRYEIIDADGSVIRMREVIGATPPPTKSVPDRVFKKHFTLSENTKEEYLNLKKLIKESIVTILKEESEDESEEKFNVDSLDMSEPMNSLMVKFLGDNISNKDKRDEFESDFTTDSDGESGTFKFDGDEYRWIIDEDTAERIAEDQVYDDLSNEHELYSPSFLQDFIYITDTDKRIIAGEEADNIMDGMEDEEILKRMNVLDEYEELENSLDDLEGTEFNSAKQKMDDILDKAKDDLDSELADEIYDELNDPIKYFVEEHGIYSTEDLLKANFISIDYNKAASYAVKTDGWENFLSRYDGDYDTTKEDVVYFRES